MSGLVFITSRGKISGYCENRFQRQEAKLVKVKVRGFTSHLTAKVILGQVIGIVICGS